MLTRHSSAYGLFTDVHFSVLTLTQRCLALAVSLCHTTTSSLRLCPSLFSILLPFFSKCCPPRPLPWLISLFLSRVVPRSRSGTAGEISSVRLKHAGGSRSRLRRFRQTGRWHLSSISIQFPCQVLKIRTVRFVEQSPMTAGDPIRFARSSVFGKGPAGSPPSPLGIDSCFRSLVVARLVCYLCQCLTLFLPLFRSSFVLVPLSRHRAFHVRRNGAACVRLPMSTRFAACVARSCNPMPDQRNHIRSRFCSDFPLCSYLFLQL